ncbi:hypothetical protein KFK09_005751 [Dendrobium nobile]|uniref:SOSEKI DIX-like domain-containing protein n=1 Tax=Dendrobium nobile TaxID=94219 RepID=A0A8T3C273_DENNO|nr:hypothetical protein KFK09_005751 [Dendrobium nobile]
MSNSRKNKSEKAKQVCEEMDGNRRREGGGGGGGGGETRRIHVVYFLSRNGKTEQPHLIRVHHLNNNGVHLRDVKRWLSELRGREMPESFSWSYKRSYKAGHIWQDLTDNDLITPFSDNEYILKGSLIPSQHNKAVEQFFPFNGRSTIEDENELEEEEEEISYESLQIEENISPKPPPRGDDEESPLRPVAPSTSTNSSEEAIENHTAAKSKRREEMKKEGDQEKSCNEVVIKKSGSNVNRSNSKGRRREVRPRRRAADILRNLLRCRLVDIKDSLKRESRQRNGSISRKNYQTSNSNNERTKNWGKKGSNGGSRKMTEKSASVRYKPSTEPNCSQCGKPFKPEKLHSHMKSCMALKEKGRSSSFKKEEQTATRRPSKVTVTVL